MNDAFQIPPLAVLRAARKEEVAAAGATHSQSREATKKKKRTCDHGPLPLLHSTMKSFAAKDFYLTCSPGSATIATLICAPGSARAAAAATLSRITKMHCYAQYE